MVISPYRPDLSEDCLGDVHMEIVSAIVKERDETDIKECVGQLLHMTASWVSCDLVKLSKALLYRVRIWKILGVIGNIRKTSD